MSNEYKVYYGEYSLRHWLELILKKDIILPPYQREYVWREEHMKKFINSLSKKQFIPPVTIARYTNRNVIIDGQQRLTSLLLAYLDIFPNRKEWQFDELTNLGSGKQDILEKIKEDSLYKKGLDLFKGDSTKSITEDFLDSHYLGFSYIVPHKKISRSEQNKYFSEVFTAINVNGIGLNDLESRKALYYLDDRYVGLFSPDFMKEVKVNNEKADFVKMLAFLSEYNKIEDFDSLAKGYGKGRKKEYEEYYQQYVNDIVNDVSKPKDDDKKSKDTKDDDKKSKFLRFFEKDNYQTKLNKFKEFITEIGAIKKYSSIVDMEMYFFGSLHYYLFKDKYIDVIDEDKIDSLNKELNSAIEENKSNDPNAIRNIRERMRRSIEIYEGFVK